MYWRFDLIYIYTIIFISVGWVRLSAVGLFVLVDANYMAFVSCPRTDNKQVERKGPLKKQ